MAAWYCKTCEILHPTKGLQQGICPECGAPMQFNPYGTAPVPLAEPEPGQFDFLNVQLEIRDDAIVLDSHELIRAGIQRRLNPGEIFEIAVPGTDATFYIEILDYSYSGRLYVVREFKVEAPGYVPEEWVEPQEEEES